MKKLEVFINSVQSEFAPCSGNGEMFNLAKDRGLKPPLISLDEGFKVIIWRPAAVTEAITDHVTDHVEELVVRILQVLDGEMSRPDIMEKLGLKHRPNFMGNYIQPALDSNYIEMTLPDKPTSINQKYRLTPKGIAIKQQLENKK